LKTLEPDKESKNCHGPKRRAGKLQSNFHKKQKMQASHYHSVAERKSLLFYQLVKLVVVRVIGYLLAMGNIVTIEERF